MQDIFSLWSQKRATAEQIANDLRSGWVCSTDIAAGIPYALLETVGAHIKASKLQDVTVYTMLDIAPMPILSEDFANRVKAVSWFSGAGLRQAVNGAYGDVMPCHYSDIPFHIDSLDHIDAFFCAVSPMDKHGYFSLGVNGSISPAMIKKAKYLYLEVNDKMPRTLCSPAIHISQVTAFCEHSSELPVSRDAEIDDVSEKIGGLIAEEIPNGSTIQLGIGSIPNAVGKALRDKRNLGIHTEMLADSLVELYLCGAADNSMKPIHKGKTVATFCYGSKQIYDYINENPSVEILPVDYVNSPSVIARHPDFRSVNSALAVDFYGQVCAESLGTRHVSGTGGQSAYVQGATRSVGGKSFIAFPSTAKNGAVSRINPVLAAGSIVTTSKNDVDYIVTEYGVAKLRGKPLSQRTAQLIAISHPKFRDALLFEAKKMNIMV